MNIGENSKAASGDTETANAGSFQNNIAATGKYERKTSGEVRTRDWQLYLFFRILKQSEVDSLKQMSGTQAVAPDKAAGHETALFGQADRFNWSSSAQLQKDLTNDKAGDTAEPKASAVRPPTDLNSPAEAFRAWLRLATGAGLAGEALAMFQSFVQMGKPETIFGPIARGFEGYQNARSTASKNSGETEPDDLGRLVVEQGLMAILIHEFLRHTMLGQADAAGEVGTGGVVQAAGAEPTNSTATADRDPLTDKLAALNRAFIKSLGLTPQSQDRASINIGFTHSGFEALQLNAVTLRSFPEAFRDGMAARAERLGDVGTSAPENWYGELGTKRIHGYFTGGFEASGASEDAWERVRKQIDIFNTRDPSGRMFRAALRMLFLPFGMEIMHVELGQAPYRIEGNIPSPIVPRIEHFGFRDGISQPFANVRLKPDGSVASDPNSGTPSRNGTWTPLATGELFLGHPDEDGQIIQQPANSTLRNDGTYMVFRKLEQDVIGFRNFLAQQRPGDSIAQKRLSAQMVGRWPNGTPLVLSPHVERPVNEANINDFLYAADDPDGAKCPLGAHIRRTNPRDIGGRNNVRRHRLMRRSMAYGGSLLDDGSAGDGRERGMLFFAANSRIEMQFEVIQADWINGGEFLGQAGLAKCPLTGNNQGRLSDSFLESSSGVPITGIPSFVRMRGGDYFFLPSGEALRALGDASNKLEPDLNLPSDGHSFGDPVTEELFSKKRVTKFVRGIAFGGRRAFGVRPPLVAPDVSGSTFEGPYDGKDVVFVGTHADVTRVLSSQPEGPGIPMAFAATRSRIAGKAMLRTQNLLVGTDWNHPTEREREILFDVAQTAWLYNGINWQGRLNAVTTRSLRKTLLRVAPKGRVDLVRDIAAETVYDIVTEIFGTPGPDYLTELAVALPLSESRVTKVDRDWLATLRAEGSDNPGLDSLKIWSFLVGLNLVGDLKNQQEIEQLGVQAASEMLLHLDLLINRERARPGARSATLLGAMVGIEGEMRARYQAEMPTANEYYEYVRSLLFELTLTASSIIPAVFGTIIDTIFESGPSLEDLIFVLRKQCADANPPADFDKALVRFIYEMNRLRPAQPIVMRYCEHERALPSGVKIQQHQWVAALVSAANLDQSVFPEPFKLSLYPLIQDHPRRDIADYLMFGIDRGNRNLNAPPGVHPPRTCWGRDRIALNSLVACLKAAAALPGLRRIAGPNGQLQSTLGITSGLIGKFAPFTPP